jgi:hypothetical protein
MQTKIISAFPGTGKSHFFKSHSNSIDLDISGFSWTYDIEGNKIRNPDFPRNYIEHIQYHIGSYEYILVSSHKDVRDALKQHCIFYYLVYPNIYMKDVYLERYRLRGDVEPFIAMVSDNWKSWLASCYSDKIGNESIVTDKYLSDVIKQCHKLHT